MEGALNVARTFAQLLSAVKEENSGFDLDRDQVNALLKKLLNENPAFKGTYTAWEPDAFDELDSGYQGLEGHNETGRFIPYWFRDETGEALRWNHSSIMTRKVLEIITNSPKKRVKKPFMDPYVLSGRR